MTLPFIRSGRGSCEQWRKLGEGLAAIHSTSQSRFGFDEDNYIGLNPQPNALNDNWGSFFLAQRIGYQVGLIEDPQLRQRFSSRLQQRASRLCEFLDAEQILPSLLHGDLWSGNVLCGADGRVWLIDPASYFGDAEADIAMTEMFGGFTAEFYAAYRARRPQSPGWPLKKRIYNLYHCLNHLNLFGNAYLDSCEAGFALLDNI